MDASSERVGRSGPSSWVHDGDDVVLTVSVSNVRDSLSNGFIAAVVLWGAGGGALAAIATRDTVFAVMAGVLLCAIAASIVYVMRLAAAARSLTVRVGPDALTVADGSSPSISWPIEAVQRLTLVHDGSPSRIRLSVSGRTYRWTVGQLYRQNTVEEFIPAVPDDLRARLLSVGLTVETTVRRRIRTTDFHRC